MVTEQNEKNILRILKTHQRLSRNKFLKEVIPDKDKPHPMSASTFTEGLKSLVKEGKIIKTPAPNSQLIFYSLPKIEKFERKQVNDIYARYCCLYEVSKAFVNRDFIVPKIGVLYDDLFNGLRVDDNPFIIKDKKELDVRIREVTLTVLAEIIFQKSQLKTLLDFLPVQGFSKIIDGANQMDKELGEWIKEIRRENKIMDLELFEEMKMINSMYLGTKGGGMLGNLNDTFAWDAKIQLKFEPDKIYEEILKKINSKKQAQK